jgi:RES domain-containing protein
VPRIAVVGAFYRSIDIAYANSPLSGYGSTRRGGRFNRKKSFEAYYVAAKRKTALLEVGAIADMRGTVRSPTGRAMLIVDVDLTRVLDLRDHTVQSALGISVRELCAPWLLEQNRGRFPLTQRIGQAAREERFEGIAAPSDADRPDGWNLVILPETMLRSSTITSRLLVPRRLPFTPETYRGRMAP